MTITVLKNDNQIIVQYQLFNTFSLFTIDKISGLPISLIQQFRTEQESILFAQKLFEDQKYVVVNYDVLIGMVTGPEESCLVFGNSVSLGKFLTHEIFKVEQVYFETIKLSVISSYLQQQKHPNYFPFMSQLKAKLDEESPLTKDEIQQERLPMATLLKQYNDLIVSIKEFPFNNTFYSRTLLLSSWTDSVRSNFCRIFFKELSKFDINASIIAPFMCENINSAQRLIFGNISIINSNYLIITRENCLHIGTRYNSRGLNNLSAAANEYETEILINSGNTVRSYILLRGSAPIYFSNENELIGSKFHVDQEEECKSEIYWSQTMKNHRNACIISLLANIGDSTDESIVQERYTESILEQVESFDGKFYYMINFPWHHIKSENMKCQDSFPAEEQSVLFYTEQELQELHQQPSYFGYILSFLELLSEILSNDIPIDFSVFQCENLQDVKVHQEETLIRINCADSLDRTNIVSYFLILIFSVLMQRAEAETDLRAPLCEIVRGNDVGIQIARLEALLYDSELFEPLSNYCCDTGDVISQLYTQTGSAHSSIFDLLLGEKRESNILISVQRKLANIFSDEKRHVQLRLFYGADYAANIVLQPLGELINDRDNFCGIYVDSVVTAGFEDLQAAYFDYSMDAVRDCEQINKIERLLLNYRDILLQKGNAEFANYYLFSHEAEYHSQRRFLELEQDSTHHCLNYNLLLTDIVSESNVPYHQKMKIFKELLQDNDAYYQYSAYEQIDFQEFCSDMYNKKQKLYDGDANNCIAFKLKVEQPCCVSQILLKIDEQDENYYSPESVIVMATNIQGEAICLCNLELPEAESYTQLLNHKIEKINYPKEHKTDAFLQLLSELFENIPIAEEQSENAVIQGELYIIFKSSSEQIVKLPKIFLIGQFATEESVNKNANMKELIEEFLRTYDISMFNQLNQYDYSSKTIAWQILRLTEKQLTTPNELLQSCDSYSQQDSADYLFSANILLLNTINKNRIDNSILLSLLNLYQGKEIDYKNLLQSELQVKQQKLQYSKPLSSQFQSSVDFNDVIKRGYDCYYNEGLQECSICREYSEELFSCENCRQICCKNCIEENLEVCVINGNLLQLTLLCSNCYVLNLDVSEKVYELCQNYANNSQESDNSIFHLFEQYNGIEKINQINYKIENNTLLFNELYTVSYILLLSKEVALASPSQELKYIETNFEFFTLLELMDNQVQEISFATQATLSTENLAVFGGSISNNKFEVSPKQHILSYEELNIYNLESYLIDQCMCETQNCTTFHFVFSESVKVSKFRLETNQNELNLPFSFTIIYRNLSDLDNPKKFKKSFGQKPKASENMDADILIERRYSTNYQLLQVNSASDFIEEAVFCVETLNMKSNRISIELDNCKTKASTLKIDIYGYK